jgi:hypothetical protein
MSSSQVVQGKPAAARHEAASEAAAATIGSAADLGIETVGILELGGSSLEVTFMPTANPAVEATSELHTWEEIGRTVRNVPHINPINVMTWICAPH